MEKFIFFYSPDDENGYLSNWYEAPFTYAYNHYFCSEQYMMAQKARAFDDHASFEKIMASHDPGAIKRLGRAVSNYDSETWDKIRYQIMRRGIRAKFQQNPELLEKLLATGMSVLVEASPRDDVWGVKMPASDPNITKIHKWNGRNLLGRVLMQVRSDLRVWMKSGNIDYKEAEDMRNNPAWQLSFIQAMQIPALREIVSTYPQIAKLSLQRGGHSQPNMLTADVDGSLADFEEQFFDNMGGGLPIGDLREMTQDVYDMTRFGCI